VKQRVDYKLATLVYKSLRGQTPTYLIDDCQPIVDSRRRQLRSADANVLTEDSQSTRRQEFLGSGSKSLEQSAGSAATAGRRIRTVQATFKVISFWRDRGAFVTFSCFQCAVYKFIYLLTYLLIGCQWSARMMMVYLPSVCCCCWLLGLASSTGTMLFLTLFLGVNTGMLLSW